MAYNPELPYNDLPALPPETDLDDPKLLKKANRVIRSLGRLNGETGLLPNPMLLMQPLVVQEALQSSEIEDIHTTVEDVFEADLFGSEKPGPQKEVLHYRSALTAGAMKVLSDEILPTNLIIELQSIIEPKKSGVRKVPGTAISNQATGEIIYTPPVGYDLIMDLLNNISRFAHNDFNDDYEPLIKAAVAHYQFEAIHPFRDGNGRTGRILLVLHLMLEKLIDLPILFVSEYINRNKSDYYKVLRGVTERGEWHEFIMYMLTALEKQAMVTNERILIIKGLIDDIKETTHNLSIPERLGDLIFSYPVITINKVRDELGVSRQTASTYLTKLEEAGKLESSKPSKEKLFYNRSFLAALKHV